jgi:hypothetical protein
MSTGSSSLLRKCVSICKRSALAVIFSVPVDGTYRTVVTHSASAGDSRLPEGGETYGTIWIYRERRKKRPASRKQS